MKGILILLVLYPLVALSHSYQSPLSVLKIQNYGDMKIEQSKVVMKVSPSMIDGLSGWVVLQFSGVQNPKKDDWIGVYSPADSDVRLNAPVKFKYARAAKEYLQTGSGKLSFRLINMRSDYAFVFFRNGTDHPVAVGKSNVVSFKNYNLPLYSRLALTEKEGEMRVTWGSSQNNNPKVRYGMQSGVYTMESSAESYTYTRDDMCGGVAKSHGWREPGIIHTAVLTELQSHQRYYYIYGDDSGHWSEEYSFYAAPTPNRDQNVKLAAYGDLGKAELDDSDEHWEEYPSLNTTKNVRKRLNNLDLILHIGDISYAVGYSAQWDEWLEQIHPIAGKVPYMTCIGNHERDYLNSGAHYNGTDSGGECGVAYESLLPMPTPTKDQPWYSFNYGNIHIVLISTEHNFDHGSDQYNWLERDLHAVDRTITPWLIVAGHRPMYIDSTNWSEDGGDQTVALELRDNIEHLFLKYKVDLALWGHHHSYQRTCPVYKEKCTKGATVHVVIGMAGQSLTQNIEDQKPDWFVIVDDKEYGYTLINTTANSLHMQYFNNENTLKDQFTLEK
jgi:hypothetical protein